MNYTSDDIDRILSERSEATGQAVRHFSTAGMDGDALELARLYRDLAVAAVALLPDSSELKFTLEHLLVSRDGAVRAAGGAVV